MAKGGYCAAAPGARIPHEQCRSLVCSCDCEHAWRKRENPAQRSGSGEISGGDSRYHKGTNSNGPERCVNTVISGPRRSTEEID